MATNSSTNSTTGRTVQRDRRANTTGAHVATAGVVVFLIATFLAWVSTEGADSTSGSGYETDTTIPLVAFLGIGLVVGLQYAATRARVTTTGRYPRTNSTIGKRSGFIAHTDLANGAY